VEADREAESQAKEVQGGVAVAQVYVDPGVWEVGVAAEA